MLKRITKSFSRLLIDLTHEQTINADATCQRKGILALTNSISARQRWAQSHFIRTSIISQLFEDLDLTVKEDVSQNLKSSQISQNSTQVAKLIEMIKLTMNPFSPNIEKSCLFNITSSKSTNDEVASFLLNVEIIGREAREKFIEECIEDTTRFEKPIKRNKVHTFATGNTTFKLQGKDKKIIAISLMRDLSGSVLFLSLKQKIDMGEVLKYPLTQVPLSLANVDGSMKKTPKAKLLQQLESRVVSLKPASIDVMIIDAMFFLHLLVDPPSTFGSIARYILGCICSTTSREIHFVFDKIIHPSIKDCERDTRSLDRSDSYNITG